MTRPRERTEVVDGIPTRLLEADGEDPGFVLFHGWSDSADAWLPLIERLSGAGARVVCADMPGHGGGRLEPDRPILEQWDAVSRGVVERYPGEAAVVGGYSLGGLMALRIGERPPATVRALAPIAPPGLERAHWEDVLEITAPLTRLALALPAPVPNRLVYAVTAAIYRRVGFADPGALTAEVLERYTDFWGDRRRIGAQLRALVDLVGELRDAVDLDRVEPPILLLWGRDDRVLPARAARALEAGRPGARVELLDGCGHIAPLEAPDELARHLLALRDELREA